MTDDKRKPDASDTDPAAQALAAFLDRLAALVAADVVAKPAEDRDDPTRRPSAG